MTDLAAIEGPWECQTSVGTAGVFITAWSLITQQQARRVITSQSFDIIVYLHERGRERSGHLGIGSFPTGSTSLDGHRLKSTFTDRADIPPFRLDVVFDRKANHWSGTWSLCSNAQQSVLERPHRIDGRNRNRLVGDWMPLADARSSARAASESVHICQRGDGSFVGWFDRTSTNLNKRREIDMRSGERLTEVHATENGIVLETTYAFGMNHRLRAIVSPAGQMTISWDSGATEKYHRIGKTRTCE